MAKISWKAGTLLAPIPPAMISCGTVEKPNVMTVAWTGIIASDPAMTYVSIRPERYSHELIKESGEFVINITNLALVKAADYCGVKSGRDIDKFKEMGLTAVACTEVKAPQIEQAPVSIECKVKSITNYGTHDMFLAEIVAVNVDDKYIDEDGKLWLEKAGLVAFVHGSYFTLGRNLGKFGFSVEKNPPKTPKKDFVVKEDDEEIAEVPEKEERKPYRSDRRDGNFGSDRRSSRPSGERRPYNRDGEGRPQRSNDGERRPYNRDGEGRPQRSNDGERRPYNRDGENRPQRSNDGERRPYNRDGASRPQRSNDGERRSYNRDGEGRPQRSNDGERRSYNRDGASRPQRSNDGERRSYNRDGENRPQRSNDGERRSYSRDGEGRPQRSNDGERRSYSRDGENRPQRSGNAPRKTYSKPRRSED